MKNRSHYGSFFLLFDLTVSICHLSVVFRLHRFITWKSWFISADARWSKWKGLMLLRSPWCTDACHWLTMTFSLMVMTFSFSLSVCVAAGCEKVETSKSTRKQKTDVFLHDIESACMRRATSAPFRLVGLLIPPMCVFKWAETLNYR